MMCTSRLKSHRQTSENRSSSHFPLLFAEKNRRTNFLGLHMVLKDTNLQGFKKGNFLKARLNGYELMKSCLSDTVLGKAVAGDLIRRAVSFQRAAILTGLPGSDVLGEVVEAIISASTTPPPPPSPSSNLSRILHRQQMMQGAATRRRGDAT